MLQTCIRPEQEAVFSHFSYVALVVECRRQFAIGFLAQERVVLSSLFESLFSFLEHAGDESPFSARRVRLPAVGTRLCALNAVRLNGRDLRSQQEAAGFVLELPRRAIVRVERYAALDAEGLWVRPLDRDLVKLVPSECRMYAAAYGYVLEIPPGILGAQFQIVEAAR